MKNIFQTFNLQNILIIMVKFQTKSLTKVMMFWR